MSRIKAFFMSASVIAASSIFLRCVAISFNAYVSAKIGSESMGLFTLVMSVYGLSVTLATSGVNLAAVRLTAERTAYLSDTGAEKMSYRNTVRGVMLACALYSLLFGVGAGVGLYAGAPFVGKHLLGDARTVLSLKVLAVSLPAISVSAALSGCFTGLRKGYKNALCGILEQTAKIIIISGALAVSLPPMSEPVEYACLAVVGGGAVAEAVSLLFNVLMYLFDNKRPIGARVVKGRTHIRKTVLRDTAAVSLPVAVGAYARQGLSTAEHLTIPWALKKSGLEKSTALSAYGNLHGMAFPLILFPSAVLTSAAGLLVPELAELCALGKQQSAKRLVETVLLCTALFSVGCSAAFFFFGEGLGESVYKSAEVGKMIRRISPLIPIMYADMAVDCMLKGFGEQLWCMKVNMIDSASSLILVVILVPTFGIGGYIVSVYICEILNFFLSFTRLISISKVKLNVMAIVMFPIFLALLSSGACSCLSLANSAKTAVFSLIYAMLSVIFARGYFKRKKVSA